MADKTTIEWTDATWNPLRGCARVSQGCKHCYAERVAARFSGRGQPYEGLIHPTTKGWNGSIKLIPEALQIPWRWSRGRRIFVNSMSDLFHEDVPFEFIAAVFFVMAHTTRHKYQVLTKRPARMLEFFRWVEEGRGVFDDDRISDVAMADPAIKALGWEPATQAGGGRKGTGGYDNCGPSWPYENVWLGVSVEDQATADERIPLLLECPAAVRWISAEPLLGPVKIRDYTLLAQRCFVCKVEDECGYPRGQLSHPINCAHRTKHIPRPGDASPPALGEGIGWVVAGGESGPGARPMHPDWARSLRDQCSETETPFLFKQWGEYVSVSEQEGAGEHFTFPDGATVRRIGKRLATRTLDGQLHDGYPA